MNDENQDQKCSFEKDINENLSECEITFFGVESLFQNLSWKSANYRRWIVGEQEVWDQTVFILTAG